MDDNNGNGRIETLRKRELAIKVAIATEKVRQQRKREKEDARLFSIVGEALVRAAQSPDFQLMLKQVLQAANLRDADRAFLTLKGWL